MAYSTSTPPILQLQGVMGSGKLWFYTSADPIATVNTAGYITNGYGLGMRVGDTVIVRDTNVPTTSLCTVITSSATTGAVDLSNGTAIDQTNGD